jgi:hypothetical protein
MLQSEKSVVKIEAANTDLWKVQMKGLSLAGGGRIFII